MMEVGPRKLMDFVEIWCVIENVFLATTDESLGRSMRIPTEEQPRKILEAGLSIRIPASLHHRNRPYCRRG